MFYREAGQFKTSYASRPGGVPDAAGPHRHRASSCSLAFVVVPLIGIDFCCQRGDDPVPDLLARGDRAQPPHRLHRPALARHRRLHGGRRLRLLQAHDALSRRQHPRLDRRCRASSRPRSARCSACRRCASRASISRSRRSRRSSSCRGASSACPGSTTTTSPARSRCRPRTLFGIADHRPERDADDALSRRARRSWS